MRGSLNQLSQVSQVSCRKSDSVAAVGHLLFSRRRANCECRWQRFFWSRHASACLLSSLPRHLFSLVPSPPSSPPSRLASPRLPSTAQHSSCKFKNIIARGGAPPILILGCCAAAPGAGLRASRALLGCMSGGPHWPEERRPKALPGT